MARGRKKALEQAVAVAAAAAGAEAEAPHKKRKRGGSKPGQRNTWETDAARAGGRSSGDILLSWMVSGDNYSRWFHSGRTRASQGDGKPKYGQRAVMAREVIAAFEAEGIFTRSTQDVRNHIAVMEKRYENARSWLRESGLLAKFEAGKVDQEIEQIVLRLCPNYRKLAPAFARAVPVETIVIDNSAEEADAVPVQDAAKPQAHPKDGHENDDDEPVEHEDALRLDHGSGVHHELDVHHESDTHHGLDMYNESDADNETDTHHESSAYHNSVVRHESDADNEADVEDDDDYEDEDYEDDDDDAEQGQEILLEENEEEEEDNEDHGYEASQASQGFQESQASQGVEATQASQGFEASHASPASSSSPRISELNEPEQEQPTDSSSESLKGEVERDLPRQDSDEEEEEEEAVQSPSAKRQRASSIGSYQGESDADEVHFRARRRETLLTMAEEEREQRRELFELERAKLQRELELKEIQVVYEKSLARKKLQDAGVESHEIDRVLPL